MALSGMCYHLPHMTDLREFLFEPKNQLAEIDILISALRGRL